MTSADRRRLYTLLGADGISRFGNQLTLLAVPWFVLATTGSAGQAGLTVFAGALATTVSLLFGGPLVDRIGYRRVSIIGDLASAASVAAIPALYQTIGLDLWLLLVLVFLGALFDIPASVARFSVLPDFAERAVMHSERAYAISETLLSIAALAGPPVGGVLIALIGPSNVLWFDAATFLISASAVYLLPGLRRVQEAIDRGYLGDLVDGLRFLVNERVLGPLVALLAALNLVIGSLETLILPVYADRVFESAIALGLMTAAFAAGTLAGNAIFGVIGHRLSRRGSFAVGIGSVPVVYLALAAEPGIIIVLALLLGLGVGLSLANLLEYTIYFERIPENMRARLLGIAGAVGTASVPLGRLLAGYLIDWFGLMTGLLTLAGLGLLVLAGLLLIPAMRWLDSQPKTDVTA